MTPADAATAKLVPIEVHERILSVNERQASHNRQHFRERDVLAINLMGSPGAGKTRAARGDGAARSNGRRRLGALAGDLATDNDAARLAAAGIRAESITTGSACHLDAEMVHHALHRPARWRELDYLFIENVGNLVCPAVYDLGQAANVVALAVTEGRGQAAEVSVMFHKADLVLHHEDRSAAAPARDQHRADRRVAPPRDAASRASCQCPRARARASIAGLQWLKAPGSARWRRGPIADAGLRSRP